MQKVTEQQHIDYRFSGLEDDDGDNGVDNENYENDDDNYYSDDYDDEGDGELSFDNGLDDQDQNMVPTSRHSMEVTI